MKQLVVKYKLVDGIKWSDGKPLVKADFELAYKIDCDKDSGAATYITCDKHRQDMTSPATHPTPSTWKPGDQDPLYYCHTWGCYPSHR